MVSRAPPTGTSSQRLVSYRRRADERATTSVLNAFTAAGVDVYEATTTLQDWIDADAIDGHDWSGDRPLYVGTEVWGRPVLITPEDVTILVRPDDP